MQRDILELEAFLPYRLYHLADLVSRQFATVYRNRLGLTRPEWRVLAGLGQHGTMTASAIGDQAAMHKTKVSRAVAGLERRRWLIRNQDENDRRLEHLTLTKAGLAAYAGMVPLAKAFEQDLLGRMSADDRVALGTGLKAVEAALSRRGVGSSDAAAAGGERRRVRPG